MPHCGFKAMMDRTTPGLAPAAHTSAASRDEVLTLAGGRALPVRVYSPLQRRHLVGYGAPPAPVVLHFHAGAFVEGSLDTGAAVARLLMQAGAVVVSVDYPLAPEQPFPRAVEAGYEALEWVARQRRTLSHQRAPLLVAGEEAGGNVAAAVALMARDRDGPPLDGQILLSPMLDVCVATKSLRDVRAGPVGCHWADGWRAYLPRADDVMHPYAAPGRSMRLAGLPRTLLVTAEDDPLRDETLGYAHRLCEAGVCADTTRLAQATGWPRSYYTHGDGTPPPWADEVRDALHDFLHADPPAARCTA
jgi:acetyl esterase